MQKNKKTTKKTRTRRIRRETLKSVDTGQKNTGDELEGNKNTEENKNKAKKTKY